MPCLRDPSQSGPFASGFHRGGVREGQEQAFGWSRSKLTLSGHVFVRKIKYCTDSQSKAHCEDILRGFRGADIGLSGETTEDQRSFDNDVHVREKAAGWHLATCCLRFSCRIFTSRTRPGKRHRYRGRY